VRELLALPPEKVLLRWANHQIKRVDVSAAASNFGNFGKDLKDCTVYAALLAAVAPAEHRSLVVNLVADVRSETDAERRAQLIVDAAEALGITEFRIQPADILKGNEKLNMGFMAAIFNALPGLESTSGEGHGDAAALDTAALLAEQQTDAEASREERAFRMWINSLGLDRHVTDLVGEMRDGLLVLQLMDAVHPGVVDWSRVIMRPKNVYNCVANCNYAVALGKGSFKFSLVGIAGTDLSSGNVKLTLALTWQLMRYHVIRFLSNLAPKGGSGGALLAESDVVEWANAQVAATGGGMPTISSLKEPSLGSGLFLLHLLRSIEPRSVDLSLATPGVTAEEKALNARYAISCARRLGCMAFLLHEDIVEVKPKMLLVFVATIMSFAASRKGAA